MGPGVTQAEDEVNNGERFQQLENLYSGLSANNFHRQFRFLAPWNRSAKRLQESGRSPKQT
jgi:hypothetical protein